MAGRTVTICNKRGLHARAAAKFVRMAEQFSAAVRVNKIGASDLGASGRSILSLMMLGADLGSQIHISTEGDDADAALAAIAALVEDKFGEGE